MPAAADPTDLLLRLLRGRRRIVALTGAGVSTGSGLPDWRDAEGAWKRRPPLGLPEFLRRPAARHRYWARSLAGWPRFAAAAPNAAHRALAALEAAGPLHHLVTQNVDGLHQRAGSRRVTDLHGRLDEVECLGCGDRRDRAALQADLLAANPGWEGPRGAVAPDGDADLEDAALDAFRVPDCPACGGLWKPSVVFFGESVPRARVEEAYARVAEADALLVVGTSLMVFSGWRFARAAAERGIPVAILNVGRTRADGLAAVKVAAPCAPVLEALAAG